MLRCDTELSNRWFGAKVCMTVDQRLIYDRFPRASGYHPEWVLASVSSAANALWLTEWLAEALDLRPGMRVLDLGRGRAMPSIFLRREFGVQVWATDLWFSASENHQRIWMPGFRTESSPSTPTRGCCRSPRTSSTPLFPSIPSCITERTTCTSITSRDLSSRA